VEPGRAPLLIASNRGPLSVVAAEDSDDEVRRGGGGLVSGMQAALAATPDAVWVSAAMNERERALARQAPNGRISELPLAADAMRGDFDVRLLPIDAQTYRNAYNGIANSTLWFVLHQLFDITSQPSFDSSWRRQWTSYVRYNQAFADALAAEATSGAAVMVQDYHLLLVPRMLRNLRSDVRISHFTHTPWVSADYFTTLPDDVSAALLEGMLGADLLGFHTERWAQLFRSTAENVLGVSPSNVRVFPLGTDADAMRKLSGRRNVDSELRVLDDLAGDRLVIGRIDRTEPSKNVWRGLLAYRELLRSHPEWRDRVVHVVYNNPSREDLPAYREYTARIERLAEEIDYEFSTEEWTPLVLDIVDDYPAALAVLRRSDVVFVNSVRDGMNLVVQEGLLISERDPAVVVSREAGVAEMLGADALAVNPFDVLATAEALHQALSMPESERIDRVQRMRAAVVGLPPADWFQAQLDALVG
jgi:trehalose 6-phosphate synthase